MLRYRVHIQVFAKYVAPRIDPVDGCTRDTSRVPFKVYEMYVGPILYAPPSFRLAQWSRLLPDIFLVVSPLRRLRIQAALNASSRAAGVFGYSSWILSEVLVVVVTLSATYHYTALAGTTGHCRRSLSAVLFQDGMCIQCLDNPTI